LAVSRLSAAVPVLPFMFALKFAGRVPAICYCLRDAGPKPQRVCDI